MRRVILAAGLTATMVATSPSIAEERRDRRDRDEHRSDDRHRGDRDRRHGDRDDGNVGGFVAGALVAGLIAAVVAGSRKPTQTVVAEPLPPGALAQTDAEAATAACAAATEGEGRRTYALAQVGQVRGVVPFGSGYAVDGDVLLRAGWRDPGVRRSFRCTVDEEAVRTVAIDDMVMLPAH